MSKIKDYAIERSETFWDIANKTIGECECYGEFEERMLAVPEKDGYLAFSPLEELKYELEDGWNEFWSKYTRPESIYE